MKLPGLPYKNLILLLIICIFGFCALAGASQEARLKWSFCARIDTEKGGRIISVDKSTVLQAGDQIKFFVRPQNDCFIYLFYHSSQGELIRLLPSEPVSAKLSAGTEKYIPAGSEWFELDETSGIEKFYLLASESKLEKIEALYQKHLLLSEAMKIKASADEIFAEILKLKRQHRRLTAVAEKPVQIGGTFRGPGKNGDSDHPDISKLATEISFAEFYSRTLTIDHQ